MTKQELDKKIEDESNRYARDDAEMIDDCLSHSASFKAGSKFGGQEYAKYILEMLRSIDFNIKCVAMFTTGIANHVESKLKEDGLL